MPSWSEYKTVAHERGALAMEMFVVESKPAATPEKMQDILPRHLAYQMEMEAAGKLFLAGPLSDPSGNEMSGGGMIIYRASSIEEARQLAEADPMHSEGGRTFKVRAWLVNEGSLQIGLSLSNQSLTIG
ncbi:MAG: YciI family protein [Rhizobiaceae bacterium]